MSSSYNESGLSEKLTAAVNEFNKSAVQPTDATIAYNATKNVFEVKDEVAGTALDAEAVIAVADDALASMRSYALLDDSALAQPKVRSTEPKLAEAAKTASDMVKADLKLTLGGYAAGEINSDTLAPLITVDANLNPQLDSDALNAEVEKIESDLDTVGTTRVYTRPDGKEVTVSGGEYGWEVDSDALSEQIIEGVKAGSQTTIEVPTVTAGDAYNGVGKQDWGARYIDVDLSEQHVRMYDESGALIWESDCISGKPDGEHDTSVGVFWLGPKKSPSKLIGYQNGEKIYESEVTYWMPFDGNAIGLHDASWQPGFGGTMYADGYGSHGCVNLPVSAAAELYSLTQDGDVVVSHY